MQFKALTHQHQVNNDSLITCYIYLYMGSSSFYTHFMYPPPCCSSSFPFLLSLLQLSLDCSQVSVNYLQTLSLH